MDVLFARNFYGNNGHLALTTETQIDSGDLQFKNGRRIISFSPVFII